MTTTPLAAVRWIKQRRKELGLTQEALAERAGCSWETVRKIEAGIVRPSQQLAELLVVHLAVPPAERADAVRLLRAIPPTPKAALAPASAARNPRPLPIPPTSLIGRAPEVARLRALLGRFEGRLITLVGPPGIGKTRLALAVAATLHDVFAGDVAFVELAALTDAALVPSTVARALAVSEVTGQPLLDTLATYLRGQQILLVLDNCEHLPAATPLVDTLLRAAPGLKVLATSRTPLHVYGEKEFPVPALGLPDRQAVVSPEQAQWADAVHLFVERARDVQPDFALTAENAGAVAEICARLDGLPLAIELAAARIRLLPPAALAARLDHRLGLLTGGARNLPARQQTLRGAIGWSYDLLDPAQRQLFRRLAVFQGGATLEAIAAVCNGAGDLPVDVLDGVEALVENHLVQARVGRQDTPRFAMLETIHEYAADKLRESGEEAALRLVHARYFLQLAEETDFVLGGAEQTIWLDRMEDEHNNHRAALAWLLNNTADEIGAKLELGLRLAGALGWLWDLRGFHSEGRRWLAIALERSGEHQQVAAQAVETPAFNKAVISAFASSALLAADQGEIETGRRFYQRSLDISRKIDDKLNICKSLIGLGIMAATQGKAQAARAYYEECLVISREFGYKWGINQALNNLASLALEQGDYAAARAMYSESLSGRRESEGKYQVGQSLGNLGNVAYYQGDYPAARTLVQEALTISLELGDKPGAVTGLAVMAGVEAQSGRLRKEQQDQAVGLGIDGAADAEVIGTARRAAILIGVVDVVLETMGIVLDRVERRIYEQARAVTTELLDDAAFAAARQEGRDMTLEQAVAFACALAQPGG